MATTEELIQAASELGGLADEVRGLNPPVQAASGPQVLSGGNLGGSLESFIADQRTAGVGIAADLDQLATFAGVAAALQQLELANAVPPIAPAG